MLAKALIKIHEAAKLHPLYVQPKCDSVVLIRYSKNGNLNPKYMFIGEAPGFKENEEGLPFVGKSGELLQNWIEQNKIASYVVINAVPMIPLDINNKIRKPTQDEIDYFRPYTEDLIKALNPEYIIGLGRSALNFLDVNLYPKTWTRKRIAGKFHKIGFQYHPSYYLRNGNKGINKSLEDFEILLKNKKKV